MRYDIGEYGLTRGKDVCWASPDKPIHYLWYVDGSASGTIYESYEEAVEAIKEKMRSDKETGRQDEKLKEGDLAYIRREMETIVSICREGRAVHISENAHRRYL